MEAVQYSVGLRRGERGPGSLVLETVRRHC